MDQRSKKITPIFLLCLLLAGCASEQVSDVPVSVEPDLPYVEVSEQASTEVPFVFSL